MFETRFGKYEIVCCSRCNQPDYIGNMAAYGNKHTWYYCPVCLEEIENLIVDRLIEQFDAEACNV